jgi:putative transposase
MSRYRRANIEGGMYFFTVTLADRRSNLLVEQIDLLRRAYRTVMHSIPVETIAICILPEHLHAVWQLPPDDSDFSKRWQHIKAGFSQALPADPWRSESKLRRGEKGIWQRRFWEHLLCDKDDLQKHIDYIHYNPVKHSLVKKVADWPYSSFHQYVRRGILPADWAGRQDNDCESFNYGEQR